MNKDEKVIDIIDDICFRSTETYVKIASFGNSSLAAANKIATLFHIKELDLIVDIAKCIENNVMLYDINDKVILDKINQIVRYNKIGNLMDLYDR